MVTVLKKTLCTLGVIALLGLMLLDVVGIVKTVSYIHSGYSLGDAFDRASGDIQGAIWPCDAGEEELPMVNANITWNLLWRAP